ARRVVRRNDRPWVRAVLPGHHDDGGRDRTGRRPWAERAGDADDAVPRRAALVVGVERDAGPVLGRWHARIRDRVDRERHSAVGVALEVAQVDAGPGRDCERRRRELVRRDAVLAPGRVVDAGAVVDVAVDDESICAVGNLPTGHVRAWERVEYLERGA